MRDHAQLDVLHEVSPQFNRHDLDAIMSDPPMRRIAAVRLATRYLTPATEGFLAFLVEATADYTDPPAT